jgi:hypothetical protein
MRQELAKKDIERAKEALAKGGDWERRNKLKVYEGSCLSRLHFFDRENIGAVSLSQTCLVHKVEPGYLNI